MIVVDTSAVIAILQADPEAAEFARCITRARSALMSAVSLQEASMVMAGRLTGPEPWLAVDDFVRDARLQIVPHDESLARIARDALLRFGKGRHPARLNCGDCASYALAKSRSIPLLFKGADFARTDIVAALPGAPA